MTLLAEIYIIDLNIPLGIRNVQTSIPYITSSFAVRDSELAAAAGYGAVVHAHQDGVPAFRQFFWYSPGMAPLVIGYTTGNFLQWFITEQIEEESLVNTVLDKMELTGGEKMGLYHIDKELAGLHAAEAAAEGGE